MKKHLFASIFVIFLSFNSFAQTKQAQKFVEFGLIDCDAGKMALYPIFDNLGSTDKVYIIVYTGKIYDYEFYH